MKKNMILIAISFIATFGLFTNSLSAQDNCRCVNKMATLSVENEQGIISEDEMETILTNECPNLSTLFNTDELQGMSRLTEYLQSCPKETNQGLQSFESSGILTFSKEDAQEVCYAMDQLDKIINEMMLGDLNEQDADRQLSRHMNAFNKMESAEDLDSMYLVFSCPAVWEKFMQYAGILGQ